MRYDVVPSTPTYLIKNIVNSPLCLCRSEETSKHFLLYFPRYENQRLKMLNSFRIIPTDTAVLTITTEHQLIKPHDFLTLFLSSSVNPNALVINHSYCQVHCLPICICFPYNITSFPNLNYVSPHCIVIFSFIDCSSTLSGEQIHCNEICTYITLCTFRQESIYISPGFSIQSKFIYKCVLSLYL